MANQEHLDTLKQGVDVWNDWRERHPDVQIDLSMTILLKTNLSEYNLSRADLRFTTLSNSYPLKTNFSEANLSRAELNLAFLNGANLSKANLMRSNLMGANLNLVDFRGAILNGAMLDLASLVSTDFTDATLTDCSIYGISSWDVKLDRTAQFDLTITPNSQPKITVDNLKIAQFIYLLLNNQEIRDVIDTITSKVVLILDASLLNGKKVLDALRDELRKRNYLPILFDFDKPASRDITETISTLAHLARFVIADITDAKSIPQELMTIVPNLPSVAVQPLILNSQHEYGMFEHFTRFPWVLPVYRYTDQASLLQSLNKTLLTLPNRKHSDRY